MQLPLFLPFPNPLVPQLCFSAPVTFSQENAWSRRFFKKTFFQLVQGTFLQFQTLSSEEKKKVLLHNQHLWDEKCVGNNANCRRTFWNAPQPRAHFGHEHLWLFPSWRLLPESWGRLHGNAIVFYKIKMFPFTSDVPSKAYCSILMTFTPRMTRPLKCKDDAVRPGCPLEIFVPREAPWQPGSVLVQRVGPRGRGATHQLGRPGERLKQDGGWAVCWHHNHGPEHGHPQRLTDPVLVMPRPASEHHTLQKLLPQLPEGYLFMH